MNLFLALLCLISSDYSRSDYVLPSQWAKARATVLKAHKLKSGSWRCQYSNKLFKIDDSLDIDHIIPLKYAHTHGLDSAVPGIKHLIASDTLNLVQASQHENRSKGDKGPSGYMPPKNKCFYVQRWDLVSAKYSVRIDKADSLVLAVTRKHCN